MRKIKEERKKAGREDAPLGISVQTGFNTTLDDIRRYEEVGVTRAVVIPWSPPDGRLTVDHVHAGMEDYANKVLSKLD